MMEKLKIGIIGTGVGKAHAEILKQFSEVEVFGICGQNLEKTTKFAKELGIEFATDNIDSLLDSGINTVLIAAPNDLHLPIFEKAASRKLKIIIEKPAGVREEEVLKMKSLQEKNLLEVYVDHELRFRPMFSAIKVMIDEGKLGKVAMISMNFTNNLFSDPNYKFSWMNQQDRGGGQLELVGSHFLDLAGWMIDFPEMIKDVSIQKSICIHERPDQDGTLKEVTAEDTFALNLIWGDTIVSVTNGTRGFGNKGLYFEIHGTEGFLSYSEAEGAKFSNKFGEIGKLEFVDLLPEIKTGKGIFPIGMKHFWAALISGQQRETFATLAQAASVQEIIHP